VHSSDGVNDGPHRRTAVPNAFKSVTTGADDEGRLLATRRAVPNRGEIVAHDLQGVVEVVEVLDFCNGTQAAHRHAYALPQNGAFADARVADANLPKFFLHALHHLVHPSDAARVFPKRQDAWIAGEHRLEIALQDLTAIELLGLCVVRGGDGRDAQGAVGLVAVQRAAVTLVVVTVERLQPAAQGLARWVGVSCRVGQGSAHGLGHFSASGVGVVAQRLSARRIHRRQQVGRRDPLFVEGRPERCPRLFLLGADFFFGLLAKGVQFVLRRCPLFDEELRHLTDAVELFRPRQALLRLVPLVRPRGAVTLGLGDFFHVHQHRDVVFTATLRGVFVGGHQAGVVPSFDAVHHQSVGGFFTLKPRQGRGDALLHRLEFLGH